jgi:hypothetical protein
MLPHRMTRTGAIALAIAAAAAPAAVAKPMDAPADYKLPQGFQTADPSDASPAPSQDFRHPDTIDHADGRGTYNAPEVVIVKQPAPVVQPAADGMDWADIGLGAGGVMALSLVALGGGLLLVRRRGAHPVAG